MSRSIDIAGHTFRIRPLTRREVKSLAPHGYTLMGPAPSLAQADACQEECLKIVLTDIDLSTLEDLPNTAALKVWGEINKETFGSRDEEKN